MREEDRKVALLGDVNVDLLLFVDGLPERGGEVLGKGLIPTLGGSAARTACWLSALGVEARLAACLGSDPWGDWAIHRLEEVGVRTDWLQRDHTAATGAFLIAVEPDGERTMLGARGANAELRWQGLREGWLEGVGWLHLSGYAWLTRPQLTAAEQALQLAVQGGIPISLDPGLAAAERAREALLKALPQIDVLLVNSQEAKALTGRAAPEGGLKELQSLVAGSVYLKLGKEGCWVAIPEGELRLPPLPITALDTTGAGDAFAAGVILGELTGLDIPSRAALGNLLGALASRGPSTPAPSLEEALSLLERMNVPQRGRLAEVLMAHWKGER